MWVSCRIRSESHTLTEEPFRLFRNDESNIHIHGVHEQDFVLSFRAHDQSTPEAEHVHHAHNGICAFLVALNVGAIGSFYWYDDPWVHPVLHVADDLQGKNPRGAALVVKSDTTYEELKPIEYQDLYNTALIFGIVAREKSKVLTGEYCRGLLLLRMNFYDLNFRREAFLCFYRALEHFVAVRILGVKRLTKELAQLKQGLKQIGASHELAEELREVYSIRSSQVAHSQGVQKDLTFNDVLKTKVFLDFVMHKAFKEQANHAMAARRDT
jgi:hypothetical protein